MANFDPPENHWAASFDERLRSTFVHLKDEVERAHERITALEQQAKQHNEQLAQAVADAKFWATRAKEN